MANDSQVVADEHVRVLRLLRSALATRSESSCLSWMNDGRTIAVDVTERNQLPALVGLDLTDFLTQLIRLHFHCELQVDSKRLLLTHKSFTRDTPVPLYQPRLKATTPLLKTALPTYPTLMHSRKLAPLEVWIQFSNTNDRCVLIISTSCDTLQEQSRASNKQQQADVESSDKRLSTWTEAVKEAASYAWSLRTSQTSSSLEELGDKDLLSQLSAFYD